MFRVQRNRRQYFLGFLILTVLVSLACGESDAQRRASIYDLKADPTEENVESIRRMLDDPDRDIRATALNALAGLATADAVERIIEALEDADGFVRSTAAKLLGDTGDPEHTARIVEVLLSDSDPVARQRAAEALARLIGEAAAAGLTRGLEDPMEQVRLASVEGLRRLDPGYATEALCLRLLEDPSWEVRVQAAGALGVGGDPAALPALEDAEGDANEFVRSAVANALAVHRATVQDRGSGSGS